MVVESKPTDARPGPRKRPTCASPGGPAARKRPAAAAASNDGDFLTKFLEESLLKLSKHQYERLKGHLHGDFRMSSACTGSGMAEVVHAELCRLLDAPSHVAFSCEKVKTKRQFYQGCVMPHLSSHGCMFEEMSSLAEVVAPCAYHGHDCKVESRTDVHVCGFSCKDLSKLNNCWSHEERQNILEKGLGSTGKTFASLTAYAARCRPRCLILENVDELEDSKLEENPNLDFLYTAFSSIGYSVGQKTLKTSSFGLPQARRRVYFVAIHHDSFGLLPARSQALAERIVDLVDTFQTKALQIGDLLVSSTDPVLVEEMGQLRDKSKIQTTNQDTKWPADHEMLFKSKGLTWKDLQPSPSLLANEWYMNLSRAKKEVLNYYLYRGKNNLDTKGLPTSIDLSQHISRAPRGHDGTLQTLTPKMCTWVTRPFRCEEDKRAKRLKFPEDGRILLGFEAMCLQGFPATWLRHIKTSNSLLLDLAGNAFSATVFAAVYIAALSELPDIADLPGDKPSAGDDLQALLDLMAAAA